MKQDFQIAETVFILKTKFLDWKHHIYIGNMVFTTLERKFLDWKRNF